MISNLNRKTTRTENKMYSFIVRNLCVTKASSHPLDPWSSSEPFGLDSGKGSRRTDAFVQARSESDGTHLQAEQLEGTS